MQFKLVVNNLSIINDYQTNLKKDVFYFVINDPETIADPYIAKLEITVLNYFAKTLRISLEENNAKKTADIIHKVATDFINYDVVKKSESAQKTIDFIDKQLSYVAIDLKDCEQKMQAFRKETKTSINRDFTSGYYYKIDNIEKELVQKKYQVNLIKDFIRQFNETGAIDVLSLQILGAEYKSDYFLMQKMRTIDDLNFKRERYLKEANPENKVIKEVESFIKKEKEELLKSLLLLELNLTQRISELESELKQVEIKLEGIPSIEIEFNRLNKLYSINESFYNSLINKKAEYSIAIAGFVPQNSILEQAVESRLPIYPNRNTIIATALGIATVISVVLLALRFLMFNNITSISEIKKHTDLAILGIVPKYKKAVHITFIQKR